MSFPAYENYKDSDIDWLGDVPEHWDVAAIKHIVSTPVTDGPHETPEFIDEGIPFVSAEAVSSGEIDFGKKRSCISQANHDRYCLKYKPQLGDIFMVKSGATTGTTAIVDDKREFNIWSPLAAIRCDKNSHPKFVLNFLRSRNFQEGVTVNWSFGTQQNIGMNVIENLQVTRPPLEEQKTIVSFLDVETSKIDALVSEQRRLIELLKEKRQAVISHAVTKGLNPNAPMKPSGIPWLGDVPEHWEVKRLKHVSPFISVGIVVNPTSYTSEDSNDLPFIYGGDIREGVIDWANSRRIHPDASATQEKTQLEADDLLVVRVGAPGVTAVVPKECKGGNCASVMLMRRGDFSSNWLCFVMNTRVVRFQVEIVEYGAAQKQFNIAHAVNFWVPVPDRAEQDELVAHLDKLVGEFDQLQAEAERAIELLQERRTALISAAVTGKIDVRGFALMESP